MTATENKVRFGLKNFHYAVRNGNTPGTPVHVPGSVSLDLQPQGEQSKFCAEDIAYYVTQSNQGYSGDLVIAYVPDAMRQAVWGEVLQETDKVLYELASAEPAVVDIGFQIEGDQQERLTWVYGCTISRPALGSNTIGETKEVQPQTLTITSSPLANGLVKSVTTKDTTAAVRSAWFESVYVPTI